MKRIFPALLVIASQVSCLYTQKEIAEDQFNQLLNESATYLNEKIDWCKSEYMLSEYERYDWNQETGELIFSDAGVPKVIARIQFVGSISKKSNTWLWSWDNPTILEDMKKDMLRVRAFGEKHQIEKLTTAKWPAEEADGWEMTSLAAKICQARGAFRAEHEDGFTFLMITDISWAEDTGEHSTK